MRMATLKEDWITVTRRRRPRTPQNPTFAPQAKAVTFAPYLTKPSFAQILQTPSPAKHPASPTKHPLPTMQTQSPSIRIFQLPNSPTKLRYPPSPHFQEWWGRCFHCTRKGHVASDCCNPARCLNCARDGHTTRKCKSLRSDLNPTAKPFHPVSPTPQLSLRKHEPKSEASFHELLSSKEPTESPTMPNNMPKEMVCYFHRDAEYFVHSDRLDRGIVLMPNGYCGKDLTMDSVAEFVARSKLVSISEIQVGILSQNRFLILLPDKVDREAVVQAIPRDVWDMGLSFHSYSPLFDASIDIPFIKIWLDLEGMPIELWRESDVAKAVSGFGVYLGSVEPVMQGDFRTWSVFVATGDLAEVPHTIKLKIGGMTFIVNVNPRKWVQGAVYKVTDLPQIPLKYSPPPFVLTPASPGSSDDAGMIALKNPRWFEEDDTITMNLTTLKSIFQGVDTRRLPSDLAACLVGDKEIIKANKTAYKEWEDKQKGEKSQPWPESANLTQMVSPSKPQKIGRAAAVTENPTENPLEISTKNLSQPLEDHSLIESVHESRGKTILKKASIPLTSVDTSLKENQFSLTIPSLDDFRHGTTSISYSPNNRLETIVLFPELGLSTKDTNQKIINACGNRGNSRKDKSSKKSDTSKTTNLRRSNRIKSKRENSDLANVDPDAFVDVPLKYSEGRDFLALIGCSHIPIPKELMQQAPNLETNVGCVIDKQNLNSSSISGPSSLVGKRKKTLGPYSDFGLIMSSIQPTEVQDAGLQGANFDQESDLITGYNMKYSEMVNLHLDSADEDEDDI